MRLAAYPEIALRRARSNRGGFVVPLLHHAVGPTRRDLIIAKKKLAAGESAAVLVRARKANKLS